MQKISTCLWFDNNGEEAVNFYTSIFRNSRVGEILRYGPGSSVPEGTVLTITYYLEGQEFIILNGGPGFKFTEATSMFVKCKDQAEVDEYWNKLLQGGQEQQCGWLKDKFGLCWQIIPTILTDMLQDKDPAKAQRVMQAMMKMVKIDISKLKEAYKKK